MLHNLLLSHFNPRTPCEVRLQPAVSFSTLHLFQSTHPMRGATFCIGYCFSTNSISIHAPHARCDLRASQPLLSLCISIHAPHARCDVGKIVGRSASGRFQSTHPMRGATSINLFHSLEINISIHAPHARCDIFVNVKTIEMTNFNPRTPCEVRHTCAERSCFAV